METAERLKELFAEVDKDKRTFAFDTIDEYVFFQKKVEELKRLPLIRCSIRNPERQQLTPAAKLIKEYSQVIDAKRGTLLRILNGLGGSAAEELFAKISDYE